MPIKSITTELFQFWVSGVMILLISFICNTTFTFCTQKMTVAQIRKSDDNNYSWVLFLESQRLYRFPTHTDHYKHCLKLLKRSQKQHTPVSVIRSTEDSDIILAVKQNKNKEKVIVK